MAPPLRRLLSPRSVAVVGGRSAEVVVEQSRLVGFDGDIWAVSRTRATLAGIPTVPTVSDLPGVPDAAFVSVSREASIEVIGDLARAGAGGVVCHASGFAEDGEVGARLQDELLAAAGDLPLVGPNCLGFLNYLDGVALWPEQQGGRRVDTGVAIVSQSGNLAENLTMHRRSLPLALVAAIGNSARTGVVDLVEALLDDERITAIGLHLETMPDLAGLSRVAGEALRRRVPIVALKTGRSILGARATLTHTSALAGAGAAADAVFERLGIAQVRDVPDFVETLKLLHVHGAFRGTTLASASCSGGEAAYVADQAAARGLVMPPFDEATSTALRGVLGQRVAVQNPLDYHTYIWRDRSALEACFTAYLRSPADLHLLVLDVPRQDRCDTAEFDTVLDAFVTATRVTGSRAAVVSTLPESLPEEVGARLLAAGVAPMQGVGACLDALESADSVARAQDFPEGRALPAVTPVAPGSAVTLDELTAKAALAAHGLAVPLGRVVAAATRDAWDPSDGTPVRFPVVAKALSAELVHKSDVGGVILPIRDPAALQSAVAALSRLSDRVLVEELVEDGVAELIVGVTRDHAAGLTMTVGAGGVLTELLRDSVTIALPATDDHVLQALQSLRIWPLLNAFRGRSVDAAAVLAAVSAVARFAEAHRETLLELDVNPVVVTPTRAVAVDATIRILQEASSDD